jgi:hypothetical protein
MLQHPEFNEQTDHCIYLWINKANGMGYVGKTDNKRYIRDARHKRDNKTPFDQDLQVDQVNWECITMCVYQDIVSLVFFQADLILATNG